MDRDDSRQLASFALLWLLIWAAVGEGQAPSGAPGAGPQASAPGIADVQQGAVATEQERYSCRPGTEWFLPPSQGFAWSMMSAGQMPPYEVSLLAFPSPVVSPYPENNTVHAEYYCPIGKKGIPAVVVLDILGGDFEISRLVCRHLATQGIGALFVQMAYYGPRRPKVQRRVRMISEDIDMTLDAVRQTVMDIRRAALWLSLQPEVDGEKIGIVGTSLGAFVGALAAGVEPRFRRSVFVLGGGNIAKVLWEGKETVKHRQKLEEQGFTYDLLAAKTRKVDPLTYAANIDPSGVLMVNARNDDVVLPSCTMELWEKMGKPQILWYDCNHYTMLARIFAVMAKVSAHFEPAAWTAKPDGRPSRATQAPDR